MLDWGRGLTISITLQNYETKNIIPPEEGVALIINNKKQCAYFALTLLTTLPEE